MTSRFAVAIHIMGILTWSQKQEGCGMNSESMAQSVGTHPVVVRRVLSDLQRAGLVETKRGPGGGATLARCASKITLREVYEAIQDEESLFHMPPAGPGEGCKVGAKIASYLHSLFGDVEEALRERLDGVTLDQMHMELAARMSGCPSAQPAQHVLPGLTSQTCGGASGEGEPQG
jgi:Rrf2 family protein